MKQEILFVLLDNFADWEGAYIAPNLNWGVEPGSESKYVVKTVSVTKGFVVSCGGFKVLPDYTINDIPADYAGVVLIGGIRRVFDTPPASSTALWHGCGAFHLVLRLRCHPPLDGFKRRPSFPLAHYTLSYAAGRRRVLA